MAYDYDKYSDIKKVYDAKVGWNQATTDEERQKWSSVADAARKRLYDYGYKDIADQISASGADATATRKILEQYAPPKTTATPSVKATTAPDSTTLTNKELITTNNNEVRNKNNQLYDTQTNDRNVMANKYDKLENTAYSNPFDSEESKAIMGKYDLAALYGRNNAVASGGASNGGNIDSYASANAMRQQASLINQGQMAVLDSHNNKINNVKGILESLGVYQQNQDKGMQNTIALQSNEGQRLFENEETALNNDVARKAEIANITGVSPDEWVVSNNPYMNDDGTIKDQYKDVDFAAVMAKAKATGNTQAYNAAATARYYKIMSDYGAYGKYDDGNYNVPGEKQTEAGRQFDEQTKLAKETLTAEQNATNAGYKNELDKINAEKEANIELLEVQNELSGGTVSGTLDDDAQKVAKIIKDNINKIAKEKYDVEVIKDKGRGQYSFAIPAGHDQGWWDDIVIKEVLESTLTDQERMTLLNQLGFADFLTEFNSKYKELPDGTYALKTAEDYEKEKVQTEPQIKTQNGQIDDYTGLSDFQRAVVENSIAEGDTEMAQFYLNEFKKQNTKNPF